MEFQPSSAAPSNVAQAHKPDEFVELAQIERCMGLLDRLVQRFA